MTTTVERNGSTTSYRYSREVVYACHVAFIPESEGGYSAIVLNLPGVGSCGDDLAEAKDEVIDAIVATIRSYLDAGEDVPWIQSYEIPAGEGVKAIWIDVNA